MKHIKGINEGFNIPDKLDYCNGCKMLLQTQDKGDQCNYCSVLEILGKDKSDGIYGQLKYHDKFKGDIVSYLETLKDEYVLGDEDYKKILDIFT